MLTCLPDRVFLYEVLHFPAGFPATPFDIVLVGCRCHHTQMPAQSWPHLESELPCLAVDFGKRHSSSEVFLVHLLACHTVLVVSVVLLSRSRDLLQFLFALRECSPVQKITRNGLKKTGR